MGRRVERLGRGSREHRSQRVREVRQQHVGLERQHQLVAHRRSMVALDSSPSSTKPSAARHPHLRSAQPSTCPTDGPDRRPLARVQHHHEARRPARSGPRTSTASGSRRSRGCRRTARSPSSRSRPSPRRRTATATPSGQWTTDGDGEARQLTIGSKHDRHARFSPDGRTLAFLSDRRLHVEEEPARVDAKSREDGQQVHLLPLAGGEARRLTDLPRGVDGFDWSPDGRWLLVTSSSHGPTREEDQRLRGKTAPPKPGDEPESDYHFVDRLGYLFNGAGLHLPRDRPALARRRDDRRRAEADDEPAGVGAAAWSPDSRRIAYTTNLRRDHDLEPRRTSSRSTSTDGTTASPDERCRDLLHPDLAARTVARSRRSAATCRRTSTAATCG